MKHQTEIDFLRQSFTQKAFKGLVYRLQERERERDAQAVTFNFQIPDDILQTSISSGSGKINLSGFCRSVRAIFLHFRLISSYL